MKTFARRLALLALAVPLLFSAAVRAQELTQADKEKALQLLETSKKMVLDATKDLSPAQWNFKSAPDRWSVAECMEHIAAAEDFIRGMVVEKVMVAPAAPGRDVAVIDAGILTGVPDRATKVQAPDPLKPTNRFASPQGSIDHFVDSRAKRGISQRHSRPPRPRRRQPRRNEMECLRIHPSHRRAQRTPHQANSRSQSRSQLLQILTTAYRAAGRIV